MKKGIAMVLVIVLMATMMSVSACGDTKVIRGVEYDTYGLLNESEKRNPDIQYEVIWGNVFWGIVFSETIIAPIYFFGFSLFEPVGEKPEVKGQIVR